MTDFLPGTEVQARGLRWEVVDSQPLGDQTRVRLRGLGGVFGGVELDLLTPFEPVQPLTHELNPKMASRLAEWLVYHQAFLLEQALGTDAFLAVQPGRLQIEPYQLVPLLRALRMSRPRLMLADDVGLGKTIQAGLIIAELMARRRVHRLLIITPAGPLLEQWQREMLERFGLRLEEVNRERLERIRKSSDLGANPFHFLPLAVASMDFLKQDNILDLLERTSYDLVVIDEAHHYSETGADEPRADRLEASQRRKLAQTLARRSDALLLLSATPHDGYERSFASLIEFLDPSLVDGQGQIRTGVELTHVVRRLKKHVKVTHPETGEAVPFPERQVIPRPVLVDKITAAKYVTLQRELLAFVTPELKRALRTRRFDNALAFLALLKRSVSTLQALTSTLEAVQTRFETLATSATEEVESRQQRRRSLQSLRRKLARFGALTAIEEAEQEILEVEELAQQLRLLDQETRQGQQQASRAETIVRTLARLHQLATVAADPKLAVLVNEVRHIRLAEPGANVLIYTEYVISLEATRQRLVGEGLEPILTIQGNDERSYRETVTQRFRTQDGQILVSTDAAAEGLNLHDRCHHLIHLELPWNPNRLEQRNGRIDRYGQWQTPIVRYLYLCGTFEERILARLLAKYERQRDRLRFVPNTLGVDVSSLPEEGLFAALVTEADRLEQMQCAGISFSSSADDSDDTDSAEVQMLLAEIDKSLRRFEQATQTHRWLGKEGAAADEVARQRALGAFEAGRMAGQIDLVDFVIQAVQAEGGQVNRQESIITLNLPALWHYGLQDIPGWDPDHGQLRLTTKLNLFTDAKGHAVGYLGRAHPVVRRAIEHVRHQVLGQVGGLDRRVSAARSPEGRKALICTFLGRINSHSGREFERVLAVKVGPELQPQSLTNPADWLPQREDAISTKELWERDFADWGRMALIKAEAIAKNTFAQLSRDFVIRHQQQLTQEQRDLETWFRQRVDDLVGRQGGATLPLFEGLSQPEEPPAERLRNFIERQAKNSKERLEAEALQQTFERRLSLLLERADLQPDLVTPLGFLMLV